MAAEPAPCTEAQRFAQKVKEADKKLRLSGARELRQWAVLIGRAVSLVHQGLEPAGLELLRPEPLVHLYVVCRRAWQDGPLSDTAGARFDRAVASSLAKGSRPVRTLGGLAL